MSSLMMRRVNKRRSTIDPAFRITVDTTKAGSASDTFILPLPTGFTYDCLIDWGDTNTTAVFAAGNVSHTYATSGTYQVSVTGTMPSVKFNNGGDKLKLVSIDSFGDVGPLHLSFGFYGCSNLTSVSAVGNTSAITNIAHAFRSCIGLVTFPAINFSGATSVDLAWYGCTNLETFGACDLTGTTSLAATWQLCSSLSSFPLVNTSGILNFNLTWGGCSGLTSFPLIDTSSATVLTSTWAGCSGLTSFPLIDTSTAVNISSAWSGCSGLTSFPLISIGSATVVSSAWKTCSGLTAFPLIDFSGVSSINEAWRGCTGLTTFPVLDLSSVTTLQLSWYGCNQLTTAPETICANLTDGSLTSVVNAFATCTALTGQSYKFWNWTTPPTSTVACYTGCTGLTDYATIPASYK